MPPNWIVNLVPLEGAFTGVLYISDVHKGTFVLAFEKSVGRSVWLPNTFPSGRLITVYNFVASQSSDGSAYVLPLEHSKWFAHEPLGIENFQHIKEVCSGMGGLGLGAPQAGIKPVAYLDKCKLACDALKLNGATNVIQGDLRQTQDIAKLHEASEHRRIVLGFPCQPYSSQGDQRGQNDPRALVFLATLQAAWLTQASSLILECVPGVQSHSFIKENLNYLADLMRYQVKTIVLSLQDQWPCNRVRWWAILAPNTSYSTIQHIIPDWPLWEPQEEQLLQLDQEEITYYTDLNFGQEERLLQQTGTCPTLLHSYGNVLRKCPCGCRQAAFSLERLQRGGVRGCYIISQVTGKPRFLHTSEAAILCTIPVTYKFPGDARAGLALIGQVAAPLQAQWVCLHLVRAVQTHFGWEPLCQPLELTKKAKQDLLWQRYHHWATNDSHATRHVWIQHSDGTNIYLLREGHSDRR